MQSGFCPIDGLRAGRSTSTQIGFILSQRIARGPSLTLRAGIELKGLMWPAGYAVKYYVSLTR